MYMNKLTRQYHPLKPKNRLLQQAALREKNCSTTNERTRLCDQSNRFQRDEREIQKNPKASSTCNNTYNSHNTKYCFHLPPTFYPRASHIPVPPLNYKHCLKLLSCFIILSKKLPFALPLPSVLSNLFGSETGSLLLSLALSWRPLLCLCRTHANPSYHVQGQISTI